NCDHFGPVRRAPASRHGSIALGPHTHARMRAAVLSAWVREQNQEKPAVPTRKHSVSSRTSLGFRAPGYLRLRRSTNAALPHNSKVAVVGSGTAATPEKLVAGAAAPV